MALQRVRFPIASAFCILASLIIVPSVVIGADDDNNPPPPRHKKESDSLRNRILKIQAGIEADKNKPARPADFTGPELSDREKVMQAVNRMSFGVTAGEVDAILEKGGWQVWAKEQLDAEKIDDAACDKLILQRFPWVKTPIQELEKDYGYQKKPEMRKGESQMMHTLLPECVLVRSVMSKRQFKEVMCDFWRNHFCVDQPHNNEEKTRSWTDADYEEQVIRKHVFGQFKDMLFASARHPAMLEYLDQKLSHKNSWNENYAREVMELHTLGADRGYGNADVQELSKVLTGWTYGPDFQFKFDANDHQPGPKHWLGNTVEEGYSGGEKALYMLATARATSEFISEKLVRYLVNDNPPPALVKRVAAVFRESKGNLPKVYWAILSSPEFMSRDNYRAKFKTPFQFTVSALRSTSAKLENEEDACNRLRRMGEPIYDCPDPTGYRDVAESWMDAGVLTTRWQFAWDLLRGDVKGITVPPEFLAGYKSLKSEEAELKMIEDLVAGDVGDRELTTLKAVAANGDFQRMASIILGSPSFQQR
jgi:uncharacterized protein (DUF1800 family)